MIRITIGKGNDYHCGCCRRTWEDTEDYDTFEKAKYRYTQIQFMAKELKEDIWVSNVAIVRDIELKIDDTIYESLKKENEEANKLEAKRKKIEDRKEKKALIAQLEKELKEDA